ncbi:MAG: arginine deiminase family protein [Rhodovibrionaceae bacterium]
MLNEYAPLKKVALRHVKDAFLGPDKLAAEWQQLNYHRQPDFAAALAEYDAFAEILESAGAEIVWLPGNETLTLDSIYVRDATALTPLGFVPCPLGKDARRPEAEIAAAHYAGEALAQAGSLPEGARLEGGDMVWLDEKTCAIGEGYRTNAQAIEAFTALCGPEVEVVSVPLPHYKGPSDVFHLMSMISPLDADLAVVYSPLLPVPFRNWLLERGMSFVEVPDEEFASMACNVLALGPRRVLMLEGNPVTQQRIEAAGCEVLTYRGEEISRKGEGGPTCLTRPLERG